MQIRLNDKLYKKLKKKESFQSYRFVSKKHIKVVLPDVLDKVLDKADDVAIYKYNNKRKNQNKIIAYVKKGEKVVVLNDFNNKSIYYRIADKNDNVGYINKAMLGEVNGGFAIVRGNLGIRETAFNLLLAIYSIADKEGNVKIENFEDFLKFTCMSKSSYYRSINLLNELNIIEFIESKTEFKILDFTTRAKDGYFKVKTRYFSKKFFSLSINAKRLAIYMLSIQNFNKLNEIKMMQAARERNITRFRAILEELEEYFTFVKIRKGLYCISSKHTKLNIEALHEFYGQIVNVVKRAIDKANLRNMLSIEDYISLLHMSNKNFFVESILTDVLKSVKKNFDNIKKSVSAYVYSTYMNIMSQSMSLA